MFLILLASLAISPISVILPPAPLPVPITVSEGQIVNFTGSAIGGNGFFRYHWDFGDGGIADKVLHPVHVFVQKGNYTTVFTATNTVSGYSSVSSMSIHVIDVAPTVSISVPTDNLVGIPVHFSALAMSLSPIDQAAGFTYAWKFGDGTTGGGANPAHAYASTGVYTASVIATDVDGVSSEEKTVNVSVYRLNIKANSPTGVEGAPIQFSAEFVF